MSMDQSSFECVRRSESVFTSVEAGKIRWPELQEKQTWSMLMRSVI